ncbi:MAG: hypothetical protein HUU20_22400 [Pirellulales bacterium]|nr:hypothetical protein [Pirellulales bacterium]
MWRSLFLAVGVFIFLIGVECLGVEKFVMKSREEIRVAGMAELAQPGPNKVLTPPDWAPYSLMSTGAVVCLYCFTVPKLANS